MPETKYDYLKDTITVTYPDGAVEYSAIQATCGGGGTDTSDATATPADIRLDKTAYGAEGKMTGTIPDYDGTTGNI